MFEPERLERDDCTQKIAVALKYEIGKDYVPFVVAKGKCELAKKIVETAINSGVPVVKSPELAHELFRLQLLEPIPSKLYLAVAEVLAFIQLSATKAKE
ncbi:EscU/YscU/HrcU family type III secretion system export apparatus switch protein [Fervidobacterium thailandense]|uniref:Flagellar biosynthesis protein FlhB n=1 Tax=Fervidobacterium thailandense TaxID=1008305 RepID=A0A1E3G2F1_9BACT|nr:EscU/YscU/HrcU family type III secretion system export apparatus switch protein [Fervidobacterium thailandense]ODN30464.1 flagellar biosynthesis protein FlhB [Fervidobacterium thailandense]